MSYTILIVDDEREFREELRDYLYDYRIIEASNGHEALRLLHRPNEIDLVILDVMMPGLEGTDVLKEIKNISPELGIIIITGYSSKDIVIEALKGHADDYLEKPLDIDKVRLVIEKILKDKRFQRNLAIAEDKIEMAKDFIQRNYHKKVSLEDTANAVCLSPKYLSRIFRQATGKRFSEYKYELRVKKAEEFLTKTKYTVSQIADRLGYENIESFIRIFEKVVGLTPTQYRVKKKR